MRVKINGEDLFLWWSSDWNGYEVGYPHISVVGLYTKDDLNVYINTENNEVLEYWFDDDC